jgi:hypothetical protein
MSVNDITGDRIVTDIPSEKFKSGWEGIWGNKTEEDVQEILDSPSIPIPNNITLEEMRELILKYAHLEVGVMAGNPDKFRRGDGNQNP